MSLSENTAAVQAVLEATSGALGARLPNPPGVVIYKVMHKMFAILTVTRTPNVIVKCDPHLAEILKEQYAGVGHRSHLDRRFWISVDLDADVPLDEIERLIGQSYDLVCAKLTRKQQAELRALSA